MATVFLGIYNFFSRYKFLFWVFLFLLAIPVFILASKIRLEEDITKIIPGSDGGEEYQEVLGQSVLMEKLIVRVSLGDTIENDPDKLVAYASDFVAKLENKKELKPLIREVRHKVPDEILFKAYNIFYSNLPYFLEEKDYSTIDTLTKTSAIHALMEKNFATIISPMGMALRQQIQEDPLHLTTLVLTKLQSLQISNEFELYDGYLLTKDHKSLLLLISPANPPNETKLNSQLLQGIDALIHELKVTEYKEIDTEYFGACAVAVANARQIQKDINLTLAIAVISICLLFWIFFRKFTLPFILLLPVTFGGGIALAIIYLIKQQISLIAIAGGAIIVGIAVDYAIHVITHYKHTGSVSIVIKDLTTPLIIGNISTVGAFFSLLFVKSEILFDFGLFSGISLIGAILFTLIFLPQFLSYYKMNSSHERENWEKIDKYFNKPKYIKYGLLFIILISIICLFTYDNVKFESDPMALNYMTAELKKAEKDLNQEAQGSERTIYLLFKGKNLNEALLHNERAISKINDLEKEHTVSKYFGVTSLLISDSTQKVRRDRWNEYWSIEKKDSLKINIQKAASVYGFKENTFDRFYTLLDKEFFDFPDSEIEEIKEYFLKDYISTTSTGMSVIIAGVKVPAAQTDKVYSSLAGLDNLYILDKQFIIKKFISIVEEDFNQILFTSSILVFIILWLFYSRIELALITFVPMLVSWLWILGFMSIFDLHFNIVNIILSTFIFGLGDDYSIFMMDGLLMEYKNGTKNLPSYKTSILLSAITTLLGVGVLIFAKHPALQSIALVSVIGISCVLFISYVLIPILFKGFISSRIKKGLAPVTLITFCFSLFAFSFFLVGCILLIVIGVIIFKILRIKRGKLKLFYHYLIMFQCRALIYGVPYVKKRYINHYNERLTKPAIIIANHQSFLDILVLLAAHPKVVIFTNKWVWNSPFFGPVVRMAGFFCVDEGVESSIEMVKRTVDMGYSIVIFPEGSRSADCQVKRFHKGAFYLAEQLKLDLLPVVIYGTGITLPKNDFLVNSWIMAIKVLPRISYGDSSFRSSYQEKTKSLCSLIRKEYKVLQSECETPELLYQRLVKKYIYKGPILEWYMKVKVKLEKNYETLNELVPGKGKIYDIGCGYGFASYMLSYLSSEREIVGIDYDEEKISVAQNSVDTPNVSFVASDILEFGYESADGIIIYDVLHYLPRTKQEALIKKCIGKLNKGGVLIIRDADTSLKKRHLGTKISEFFSVKLLGFNKSDNKQLHFISESEMLRMLHFPEIKVSVMDKTKFNSNIIYYIQKY